MGKDKTKDGDAATSTETNRDHSQDQEARDATLAKTIAKVVARETQTIAEVFAREMAKAHAQYQATIKENCTTTLPSTLKVTSGSNGFRIMDPFDWTRDKTIYQRWQLWSHKARLTLDAMEGDSEKSLIFTIGSMEKGSQRLKDGKTTKSSSASQTMKLYQTRQASTLQKK